LSDLFLRACRREPVERTPIWFMRQAGRSLPEYRKIREKHSLTEICRLPEVCLEVTLQPVRRLGVDAAILFADIMTPLEPMGVSFEIKEHVGPVIHHPIQTADDVARLRLPEWEEALPAMLQAIRLVRRELAGKTPLIGFAGAPFTLASYLIENKPSRDATRTKEMMYRAPEVWHALMDRLADGIRGWLAAQVHAGVQAVQLFDSWVGALSPADYREFVLPYSRRIFEGLAGLGVPRLHFGTGTAMLLPQLREAGADVVGADWRIPLDEAWRRIGHDCAIQGNLDPAVLLGPADRMERAARDVLARAEGRPGHVFNLGHGVLPDTPVANLERLVEVVRNGLR